MVAPAVVAPEACVFIPTKQAELAEKGAKICTEQTKIIRKSVKIAIHGKISAKNNGSFKNNHYICKLKTEHY